MCKTLVPDAVFTNLLHACSKLVSAYYTRVVHVLGATSATLHLQHACSKFDVHYEALSPRFLNPTVCLVGCIQRYRVTTMPVSYSHIMYTIHH